MKVVWFQNNPVGFSSRLLNNNNSQSGGWVDATFDSLKPIIDSSEMELHIFTPAKVEKNLDYCKGCTCHYLKWHSNKIGKLSSNCDVKRLMGLLNDINPDFVMAWGTEYSFNYHGIMCAEKLDIPSLIYIQGLTNSFIGFENAHLPYGKMSRLLNNIDRLKLLQQKMYYCSLEKQAAFENEIFKKCYGVISDNDWCFEIVRTANPQIRCFRSLLPISNCYIDSDKWSISTMKRHQIFTIAGRTAYKGLHNLIEAIRTVKIDYPDVKLIVPGYMGCGRPKLIKKSPYISYLEKMIEDYDLTENIAFVGKLTSKEMKCKMRESHCFVMPSCVENHSSTLREAMFVGIPAISSVVGSISELIENNQQALLYRYDDVYSLSRMIKKLFQSDDTCTMLSKNGNERIVEFYSNKDCISVEQIYREMMIKQ